MRTDTVDYSYRRCGELLELFIRNRGKPIEPLSDDDVNLAEGLIRCGMVTGDVSKGVVLANSVTPAGLEYLETIRERVWWRRLLKKVGVAIVAVISALLGTLWQRASDFAFESLEISYSQVSQDTENDQNAKKSTEQVPEINASAP
ncbi:MAG: hypothetical protein IJI73_04250 [Kiritimatiellae bacterium]|nr:hypothetical protein [Kiritimatiellia bacterium]MBQ6136564.1 hypothetical protein [Kiritimatiellia bacterium]